eukprot:scaffold365507_cov44-Prasinocladus_malaysianus.AAC.1
MLRSHAVAALSLTTELDRIALLDLRVFRRQPDYFFAPRQRLEGCRLPQVSVSRMIPHGCYGL